MMCLNLKVFLAERQGFGGWWESLLLFCVRVLEMGKILIGSFGLRLWFCLRDFDGGQDLVGNLSLDCGPV